MVVVVVTAVGILAVKERSSCAGSSAIDIGVDVGQIAWGNNKYELNAAYRVLELEANVTAGKFGGY